MMNRALDRPTPGSCTEAQQTIDNGLVDMGQYTIKGVKKVFKKSSETDMDSLKKKEAMVKDRLKELDIEDLLE